MAGVFYIEGKNKMKEFVNKPGAIEVTDTITGQIKTVKLVTDKQLAYIRILEKEAGLKPKKYTNLTIWNAVKVIEKLKEKTKQKSLL